MANFLEHNVRVVQVTAYCNCGGILNALPIRDARMSNGKFEIKHACLKCEAVEYLPEPFPALRYVPEPT